MELLRLKVSVLSVLFNLTQLKMFYIKWKFADVLILFED